MSKKVDLIFTLDLPYPDNSGGRKLTLGRVLNLAEFGSLEHVCYNFKRENVAAANEFLNKYNVVSLFYTPVNNYFIRLLKNIVSIFYIFPRISFLIKDSGFKSLVKKQFNKNTSCDVYIENIYFVPFLIKLLRAKSVANIYVCFQNAESVFYKELSKSSNSIFYKIHYFIESIKLSFLERYIAYLSTMDKRFNFVFLSDVDMSYYLNKLNFNPSKCSLNKNDIYIEKCINHEPNLKSPFFLFPGSIDFPPNFNAISSIAEIYEKSDIDIPIIITGPYSLKNYNYFKGYKKIKFLGLLSKDDLYDLYSKCISVISPVLTGSGIKIKNLETIKLGVPIITTKFADIGIPDSDFKIVVDNNPNIFVDAMVNLACSLNLK